MVEVVSKTKVVSSSKNDGGYYYRLSHESSSTHTKMIFGLYLPSCHGKGTTPVLFWLSGLTCDDTNFAMKAGSRAFEAAEREVSSKQANKHKPYFCTLFFILLSMYTVIIFL